MALEGVWGAVINMSYHDANQICNKNELLLLDDNGQPLQFRAEPHKIFLVTP